MNLKPKQIFVYSGLFLFLTGFSYFIFSKLIPVGLKTPPLQEEGKQITGQQSAKKTGVIEFSGPKTEICPINGALFTKEEQAIWQTRRPLMVMIENHTDSRPQSGLANADIVYEAVAEGGITRFMGIFYCGAIGGSTNKYDVGPVRSARAYFLDLASEYSDYPLYTHVGGANCSAVTPGGPCTTNKKAQAIEQISSYGWMNKGTWSDLSQFALSYKACRREPERTGDVRDTEHTMYCSTKELWNVAASRGLTNQTEINKKSWNSNFKNWQFTQKDQASETISAPTISFDFWSGYKDYSVTWDYDKTINSYKRTNGAKQHLDFNVNEIITAKNIIVQYAKESRSVDGHGHNLYEVIGSGTGLLFQNGTKVDITWAKTNRVSRTIFKDKTGKEINLVPGITWIEIIPKGNLVNYENSQ